MRNEVKSAEARTESTLCNRFESSGGGGNFSQKVLKIVSKIPKGQVLTYKQVAKLAGNSKAARVVGNILKQNYLKNEKGVPCHRVIRSDGSIGGYAKGQKEKEKLLISEGVKVVSH